jgi:hypothetical protein
MTKIVKLKAEHLDELLKRPGMEILAQYVSHDQAKELEKSEHAFSAINEEDKVVACAGIVQVWQGRGKAWAIIDRKSKQDFLSVHRAVKRFLSVAPHRRLEADVDCEYAEGHRWMKLLGFSMEAQEMKKFRPDGGSCSLYAKVREV